MNVWVWLVAKLRPPDETTKTLRAHKAALRRVRQLERERFEFEALEKPKK